MKLGLHIADFTWDGGPAGLRGQLADVAQRAEAAGFDRVSVMDHVWQIGPIGPVENEMLEAYTALGYLAAVTERVKLLTVVTAVVYRDPGLLAKSVTTLDVLSGGRAMLGIGAAWNEEESRGLEEHLDGCPAVQLPKFAEFGGQMAFGMERRKDPQLAGQGTGPLPGGEPQGAKGTDGHVRRFQVSPPARAQRHGHSTAFSRRNCQRLDGIGRTCRGLPGIPDHGAEPAPASVSHRQRGSDAAFKSHIGWLAPLQRHFGR